MRKIIKNPYFLTGLLASIILLVLFIGKKIYPFGTNTLIYGDMHDQITAFYYHFYDCFYGNSSFFIDFSTSGGINFFGILSYYIFSPFSFILLLFKRENIYLAVSIIIALKMIAASLTCLYAIRTLFQKKDAFLLSIILALSYAFSGYTIILYQITPWMDAMILFPLIVVGVKNVLDQKKPYLYIVSLTLSIICSFYVSYMSLILIFFLSFIYIYAYQEKEIWKKSITALGLSTGIAIGLSMFVTLPSLHQISESSRLNIYLPDVLNSKLGPITDKISYFLPTSFLLIAVFLLFLNWKDHRKFLKWFTPSFFLLALPYIIEPINKILHFFSYAFFPNRYGYMLFFLLVLGSYYYFTNVKEKPAIKKANLIALTMTLLCSVVAIALTALHYERLQEAVFKLTISKDKYLIFILLFFCISISIGMISVIFVKRSKKAYPYLLVLTVIQLICNTYLYVGLTSYQESLKNPYQTMQELRKGHKEHDFYRIKTNTSSLITNNGMVTGYHNLDHFTSLVQGKNLKTLKQLGYSSHWTKTYSKNGTLFMDSLLANQYYLTMNHPNEEWYDHVQKIGKYHLYRLKEDLPYGYFTKNIQLDENLHTFALQNKIYRAITSKDAELFTIQDKIEKQNLKVTKKKNRTLYEIIDKNKENYLEIKVPVVEKSIVYLEIFNSFTNTDDDRIYKHMKIYVNDKLYKESYPLNTNNGSLKIGTFEDETVSIKIEFLYDTELSYIEAGILPKEKLLEFIKEERIKSKVSFHKNKIVMNVNSEKEGLFFIPVTYDKGYEVTVNDVKSESKMVYGNFLGVELEKRENKIEWVYTPPYLKIGIIISVGTLLLAGCLFKFRLYQKIIDNKNISKIFEICYLTFYSIGIFFVYFVPTISFFLSYFFYIC